LPIIAVTEGAEIEKAADERKDAVICSEGFLKGMQVPDAIRRATEELEKLGAGEGRINYRLRDAAFGRQRYWGEPIPIYYKDDIPYPLPESELPLVLPEVDKFLPTETGEPPLARAKNWTYSPLHRRGAGGEGSGSPSPSEKGLGDEGAYPLETTTMPGWAGSSWYFLRYMDPHNEGRFASPEAINYWQQIDLYMGGSEHATGHLLYFRFWTKFLFDRGWIPFDEPAKKLVNQGMIQGVSKFAEEIRIEASIKSQYDQEDLLLRVKRDDRIIGIVEVPGAQEVSACHVYCNTGSSLDFEFIEKSTGKELATRRSHNHAKIEFVVDGTLDSRPIHYIDIPAWLHAEPIYHPIVISELPEVAIWRFDIADWRTFDGGKPQKEPLWTVRPEVEKMSKSKFNVVNPDDIIEKYGADTLRLYEMFLGPAGAEQAVGHQRHRGHQPLPEEILEPVPRRHGPRRSRTVDPPGRPIRATKRPPPAELKSAARHPEEGDGGHR
jgi:leucyl-tRNA synthetase